MHAACVVCMWVERESVFSNVCGSTVDPVNVHACVWRPKVDIGNLSPVLFLIHCLLCFSLKQGLSNLELLNMASLTSKLSLGNSLSLKLELHAGFI